MIIDFSQLMHSLQGQITHFLQMPPGVRETEGVEHQICGWKQKRLVEPGQRKIRSECWARRKGSVTADGPVR